MIGCILFKPYYKLTFFFSVKYVTLMLFLKKRRVFMAEYFPDSPYVVDNVGSFSEELMLLLSTSATKNYNPGEIIYLQGEPSKYFYFLKDGKVKVSIFKEDGSEKILAIQENNTFFGESAAFDRYPYFATATAMLTSRVCCIKIEDAETLIQKHPRISFLIITSIIRKLRLLGLQVEDLTFLDAQKRVVHIILKLLDEVGFSTKDGIVIEKRLTHEDLASLTGLSRVTVTNVLNYLEKLNLISKGRQKIMIINKDKLSSLMEEPT